MLSAICFNLDLSEILLPGNGLNKKEAIHISFSQETNADTSKDEELARMLQEEMFNEQEESDAALARRLQEEEQNKRRVRSI